VKNPLGFSPTAVELLRGVIDTLTEMAPHCDDDRKFQVKVARHILRIVERELVLYEETLVREASRLALMGIAENSDYARLVQSAMGDRNEVLSRYARERARDALRIDNPDYLLPEHR
jgi:Domain of unknown function (DUF6285)